MAKCISCDSSDKLLYICVECFEETYKVLNIAERVLRRQKSLGIPRYANSNKSSLNTRLQSNSSTMLTFNEGCESATIRMNTDNIRIAKSYKKAKE